MKKLQSLINSAKESCSFRGHKMDRFNHNEDGYSAYSACLCCGKTVVVNTRPMPNDIDICGEAVALNCK